MLILHSWLWFSAENSGENVESSKRCGIQQNCYLFPTNRWCLFSFLTIFMLSVTFRNGICSFIRALRKTNFFRRFHLHLGILEWKKSSNDDVKNPAEIMAGWHYGNVAAFIQYFSSCKIQSHTCIPILIWKSLRFPRSKFIYFENHIFGHITSFNEYSIKYTES